MLCLWARAEKGSDHIIKVGGQCCCQQRQWPCQGWEIDAAVHLWQEVVAIITAVRLWADNNNIKVGVGMLQIPVDWGRRRWQGKGLEMLQL